MGSDLPDGSTLEEGLQRVAERWPQSARLLRWVLRYADVLAHDGDMVFASLWRTQVEMAVLELLEEQDG